MTTNSPTRQQQLPRFSFHSLLHTFTHLFIFLSFGTIVSLFFFPHKVLVSLAIFDLLTFSPERRTYLEKLSPTPPVFKHFDLISGEVSNGFVGILLGSCRQMPFAALFLCFLRLNDLDILSTPFLFPSLIIRLISLICHICH